MGEEEEGIRGLILLPPWLAGERFAREILGYTVLPRGRREAKKKRIRLPSAPSRKFFGWQIQTKETKWNIIV